MVAFKYIARNAAGGTARGSLSADSISAATETLKRRGLLPLAVVPEAIRRAAAPVAVDSFEPAGPSIASAVSAYAAQRVGMALRPDAQDHAWKLLVTRSSLIDMLRYAPDELPDWVGPTVAAAEEHGAVDATLPEIENAIREDDRRRKVFEHYTLFWQTTAAIAPLIVGVVLHVTSRVNASVAGLVRHCGPILFISNLLFFGMRALWRCRRGRVLRQQISMSLPIVGRTLQAFALQRFARFFAAFRAHGLDARTAFGAAAPAIGVPRMAAAVRSAAKHTPPERSLRDLFAAARVFPDEVLSQIAIYEQTGQVDQIASGLVEDCDRRARQAQSSLHAFGISTALLIGLLLIAGLSILGTHVGQSAWLHDLYWLNENG